MRSHLPSSKRLVALPLLAILLVSVAFAGTAVAEPRIWIVSSNVAEETTLVGESTDVRVHLENEGDGGAFRVDISANGTVVASERFQLEAQSEKRVRIPVSIDEPGTYEITADDRNAGTLTVTRFRIASIEERDDGRTTLLRAGEFEPGTPMTVTLPDADGRSFDLERTTMVGSGSPFNRSVATYAPTANAPFSVPSGDSSTVIGAVDMDSISGVETTSMRVAIDRDAIRESGIQANEVAVYRKNDESYTPLETAQTATTAEDVVYEATTDGGSQFVVGSLGPSFVVRSQKLSTGNAERGKLINVTATVANDGVVEGNYTAEMRVDGATVDERSVAIPAGETSTIQLQHLVTQRGNYEVSLGNRSAGSVVITGDATSSTERPSPDDSSTDSTETRSGDGGDDVDAGSSLPSLDVSTMDLGIGAGIVVLGGGLLLLVRR